MGIYEHAQRVKKAAKGGVAKGSDIQKVYQEEGIIKSGSKKTASEREAEHLEGAKTTESRVESVTLKQAPPGQTTPTTQRVTYYMGPTPILSKTIPFGADPMEYAPNIPIKIPGTEFQTTAQQRKQIKDFRAAGGTFKYEQVPKSETGGLTVYSKTKPVEPKPEVKPEKESWWREKVEKKITESNIWKSTFGKAGEEIIKHYEEKAPKQTSFMSVIDKPAKKVLDKPFDIKIIKGEKFYSKIRAKQELTAEFTRGATIGYVQFKKDYPVATAGLFAAGATLPGAIGGIASKAGSKLIPVIGASATKGVGAGVQTAALTGVTYLSAKEIQAGEGALGKGKKTGKIAAIIEPVVFGGLVGSEVMPKIKSKIRTIGRKEIPTEKLVPKDVLSGQKRFPTAPPKTHPRYFAQSGKMYHATGEKLGKEVIVKEGYSEVKGLYGAHKVSPHFLRTGHGEVGIGEWKPGIQPTVMEITPKGFQANPKMIYPRKLGVADIPMIKTEIEAVMPPETALLKTSGKTFFKFKGYNVPIDKYKVAGAELLPKVKEIIVGPISKIAGSGSSSAALPVTSKVSPSSTTLLTLTGIGISSSKPSAVSRFLRPSYPFSFRTSPVSSPVRPSPPSPPLPSPVMPSISSPAVSRGRGGPSVSPIISVPSSPILPPVITPSPPAAPPTGFIFRDLDAGLRKKKKIKVKVKQPKKYKPTLTSATFNIFGKPSKVGIISGLGIRPIPKVRKK